MYTTPLVKKIGLALVGTLVVVTLVLVVIM